VPGDGNWQQPKNPMNSTFKRNIIVTGGAGFIGSHLVRRLVKKYPEYRIINYDKLTYAGNLENLKDIENAPNYVFIKADICDAEAVEAVMSDYSVDAIIHLAAESHVDRSITNPLDFVNTNVIGTVVLLQAAKKCWSCSKDQSVPADKLFYHVSTDEVYGSLGETGMFTEKTSYDPHSPYSASKASSDHFVRAWADTYNLPVVISNCSNNYGPFHFPEKLIPLTINNIRNGKAIPVYGKGENVRDWLFVEDHAAAIDVIFHSGKRNETYNIGGNNEMQNIEIIRLLCKIMDERTGKAPGTSEQLITFVKDRAGHDFRYAIDSSKLQNELGWQPSLQVEEGLEKTVDWYLANTEWLQKVTSGNYQQYYENQYIKR
jgi:dTDP-glucose 4,6-dehydratase